MDIKAVGLDIGKSWFHFVGCNRAGKPIAHHKFNRGQLMQFMVNLPSCLVGMEACPGSQHLARTFQRYGHDVRLIAPKFIKAYLKSHKNDFNDAEAIAEAVARPDHAFRDRQVQRTTGRRCRGQEAGRTVAEPGKAPQGFISLHLHTL